MESLIEKCYLIENYLNSIENVVYDDNYFQDFENFEKSYNDDIFLIEKIKNLINSIKIIYKYKNHPLIKYEIFYQKYRIKFSNAYLQGSDWDVGNSFIEYVLNKKMKEFNFLFTIYFLLNTKK